VLVLGVPVRREADQIALTMLARLMPPDKVRFEALSSATLAGEALAKVGEERPAVLVIGALPPRALAGVRYLCKRLRAQYPQLKILVGCWGLDDDLKRVTERLTAAGADAVVTSVLEARRRLMPLVRTAAHGQAAVKPSGALQPVG
jgi:hypothetical protein